MEVKGFDDTIKWYDANAKQYADATSIRPHDLLEQFIKLLPKNPRVLDVGCGPGRDTNLLAKLGAQVTGLDISAGLLEEARKRNPDLEFVEGNFLEIPFEDNTLDGVWAHAALVHLEEYEDAKKAFAEFQRVLKSKGILHVYVKKQMGENKTEITTDKLSQHERFFRYYTEQEIQELLHEFDFNTKQFEIRSDPNRRKGINWISVFAEKED